MNLVKYFKEFLKSGGVVTNLAKGAIGSHYRDGYNPTKLAELSKRGIVYPILGR